MRYIFVILLIMSYQLCLAQTTDDAKYEQAETYYKAKEYDKAAPLLKDLADKNYAKAMNLLGVCYKYGYGVPKDAQKKIELYQKSANLGWRVAQRNLGICYQYGDGVEQDYDIAITFYNQAVNNNDTIAMVKLGWLYRSDEYQESSDNSTDYNYKQAEKWFRMAAKTNNAEGFYGLACFYLDIYPGDNIIERMNKSAPFFEKAAKLNYGYAQIAVGYADMREEKYQSALGWFNQAKKNGCKNNFGLTTDTWITICKFFIDNPQYSFYWDNDCCSFGHCVYEENDYIYIGALLNNKFGFLKISKNGRILRNTPFIYDGNLTFPYYDKDTHFFHITKDTGEEIIIDITGKERK